MENIVEVRNVIKRHDQFSLNDISLDIKKGYITGLIGPNGAGKTTLIQCLMQLIHIDDGQISLFGKSHQEDTVNIKERIGFVYDENYFYEDFTLEHNKRIVSMFYKQWDDKTFYHYLNRFKLSKHQKVKNLSKGMKIKFSLTVALSHHPQLIIMDEPTSGLDPIFRRELLDILLEIIQDENKAIFFSTHMVKDLEQVADYIAFLNEGELVFSDEKDAIIDRYAIVKGHKDDLNELDRSSIIGIKESSLGFEALLLNQSKLDDDLFVVEKPSLEDIMYYTVRGKHDDHSY